MLNWIMRLRGPRAERKLMALTGAPTPHWSARDPASFGREGYARNAIAYRCVRLIAEAAASARLRIAPIDHPLQNLFDRPNPEQTGIELMEAFFGHLQVSGDAFLHAGQFDEEPPTELHVLRPDRVTVLPGPDGWPIGWEHRSNNQVARFERDPLTGAAPILHLKLFHPLDDWRGLSPMEAAACAIDIHNAGGAWNKALIDNAARPSGALVYSGVGGADRLTDEQFARLRSELEEAHQGAINAGRPLLLEGGLDWRPMSLSPADMDFIDARHAAAREIALAFGVPPMLLGIPGDNTYATYREANLAFWRLTALPLAFKAARALEAWLGRAWPGQPDAKITVETGAIPALAAERDALFAALAGANFMSDEEKRLLACWRGDIDAMSIDPRITIAALVTLLLQAAGAFLWAGQASARLEGVERRLAATPPVTERLARLEEQVAEARRSLARIEDRLEPRR